jgi:hypothetical protein
LIVISVLTRFSFFIPHAPTPVDPLSRFWTGAEVGIKSRPHLQLFEVLDHFTRLGVDDLRAPGL